MDGRKPAASQTDRVRDICDLGSEWNGCESATRPLFRQSFEGRVPGESLNCTGGFTKKEKGFRCLMVTRKSLLTGLAVAVPAGVFALTAFTEPVESVKSAAVTVPVIAPPVAAADCLAEPEPAADRIQSWSAITVSARSRNEKNTAESAGIIEAFTEPYRDVAVAAPEMGALAEIKVVEGDTVKRGDLIAVLDDDILRASLEVARRSMSAEGMLQSAQADLQMKKTEQEKLKQLRERNHASQQELDRMETDLLVAEARLLSVREELEVKQLEFRRIEAQLEQRSIRAPLDGIISDLSREAGEFVSPSDPTIARIVQLDRLLVVFSVPLAQRNYISKDQRVRLKIGASEDVQEGIVEYVSPTSDSSNSSVRVKVRVPNSDGRLQSGERTVLELAPAEDGSSKDPQEATPVARREP